MPKEKIRLDNLLVRKGFCEDEKRAESLILSGSVLVENQKVTKAGLKFLTDVDIRLIEKIPDTVSRAGKKLNHALDIFKIHVTGKICLDFGASTGGFTEALLEKGAEKVYAFDVGYGQIAGKLRNDKRVIVRDRFNVKNISTKDFSVNEKPVLIVMDLSFISLLTIFPVVVRLKKELSSCNFEIVSLIKPQFECSAKDLEKGIVKKKGIHFKVIRKICKSVTSEHDGKIKGLCESPILGAKGNKEFFIYWIL